MIRPKWLSLTAIAGLVLALVSAPVQAICMEEEGACEIASGSYHMLVPEGVSEAPRPVLVFLHGFGSHGGNTINNRALTEPALARGYVVVAPSGLPRRNGNGSNWVFHPDQEQRRDELVFLNAVLEDVATRTSVNRDRVVLGGFSSGGFMVSYLACRAPEAFHAFVPLAGGFWRPHPETCNGPVKLLHTHGWQDRTVPLEGRPLGSRFEQGDIFATMEIWRRASGCAAMQPDHIEVNDRFWQRSWRGCDDGFRLDFLLHPGNHNMPTWWPDVMLDWVEALDDFR